MKIEDPLGPSQIFSQPHVPPQKNLKMTASMNLPNLSTIDDLK